MKDTIFMIHGMWGGAWVWDNYRRIFEAEGYRCITPTLPYHNISPGEPTAPQLGTASLLDYADVLEQEIKKLDVKPIIMGHSMGGLLAQILAARGLAKSVVLLCPAPPAGIIALSPALFRSSWSIQTTWGFWKKPILLTYSEAKYSIFNLFSSDKGKELYSKFIQESGRVGCEIFYWFLDPHNASKVDETKVTCPVLVVAGKQDHAIQASVVRRIAKKYSAVASYKEFNNHAHWIVGEPQWEEVAEHVSNWMAPSQPQSK